MPWHAVPGGQSLSPGEMVGLVIAETPVALCNVGGELFATSNVCTHSYALLTDGYLEGREIECPLHQAVFNVSTGELVSGPGECGLKTFPLKDIDGVLHIEI